MRLRPVDHPILGRLVPDLWGGLLMCFRRIPGFAAFGPRDSVRALERLGREERELVEHWKGQPEVLAQRCREGAVFRALQSLGVFEVAFGRTPAGIPSEEQVAAYRYFQAHEDRICREVGDAVLRYYLLIKHAAGEGLDSTDWPEVRSPGELGRLATLDGLLYTSYSCEGLAVISLGWQVDWDMEHGLSTLVWKDHVVGIGVESIEELSLADGSDLLWNRSQMTEAERAYLDRVLRCLGGRDGQAH